MRKRVPHLRSVRVAQPDAGSAARGGGRGREASGSGDESSRGIRAGVGEGLRVRGGDHRGGGSRVSDAERGRPVTTRGRPVTGEVDVGARRRRRARAARVRHRDGRGARPRGSMERAPHARRAVLPPRSPDAGAGRERDAVARALLARSDAPTRHPSREARRRPHRRVPRARHATAGAQGGRGRVDRRGAHAEEHHDPRGADQRASRARAVERVRRDARALGSDAVARRGAGAGAGVGEGGGDAGPGARRRGRRGGTVGSR
mmetsp:Transcript_3389/g.13806  ORF Transcript_3389/g.13806 Transcript_3389/m.13806 type:complete len:261 (+) Transcript_3389:930-1712(+)